MFANIDYLLRSFSVDHMLLPFRERAGLRAPPGARDQVRFWDTDLKGSNAGRFLMGAGNALRWQKDPQLEAMANAVVAGIAECRNATDQRYAFAYPPPGFMHSEQGDYARSWLTQGLIEIGKAGNGQSWGLLRGMYDWFNDPGANGYLPYLYDGISNGEQGQIASTRVYLETPVGKWADIQTAQDTYRDDVWLRQLIDRDPSGIARYHMPTPNHPHCYEITSFLAMFDQYRATHNSTWLAASKGAWELIRENFLHVDGTSSLTEGSPYVDPRTGRRGDWPPKSYRIAPGTKTGETCCTVFWVKLCQRLLLLDPDDVRPADEIEKAIYNGLLRQMITSASVGRSGPYRGGRGTRAQRTAAALSQRDADTDGSLPPGIRYHATMEGTQERGNNVNTWYQPQLRGG